MTGQPALALKPGLPDPRDLGARTTRVDHSAPPVCQALVRMAGDVAAATPAVSVQGVSFTVLFQAAADQVIVAPGPARGGTASLIGAVGRAPSANLPPNSAAGV